MLQRIPGLDSPLPSPDSGVEPVSEASQGGRHSVEVDAWNPILGEASVFSGAPAGRSSLQHRILEPRHLMGPHDLAEVERELARLNQHPAVDVERLGEVEGKPIHVLRVGAAAPELHVTIVAGVHGNESGGPAAGFALVQRLLEDPDLASRVRVTFIPVANPVGWEAITRKNSQGLNLNRVWHPGPLDPQAPEAAILREVLDKSQADLALDLHGSRSVGKSGFFGLHRGNSLGLLSTAMQKFAKKFPILRKSTDRYALDAPGVGTSHNTGTVKDYMVDEVGAEWSMTLEAPQLFDYETQVAGLALLSELVLREALARKVDQRGGQSVEEQQDVG